MWGHFILKTKWSFEKSLVHCRSMTCLWYSHLLSLSVLTFVLECSFIHCKLQLPKSIAIQLLFPFIHNGSWRKRICWGHIDRRISPTAIRKRKSNARERVTDEAIHRFHNRQLFKMLSKFVAFSSMKHFVRDTIQVHSLIKRSLKRK